MYVYSKLLFFFSSKCFSVEDLYLFTTLFELRVRIDAACIHVDSSKFQSNQIFKINVSNYTNMIQYCRIAAFISVRSLQVSFQYSYCCSWNGPLATGQNAPHLFEWIYIICNASKKMLQPKNFKNSHFISIKLWHSLNFYWTILWTRILSWKASNINVSKWKAMYRHIKNLFSLKNRDNLSKLYPNYDVKK